MYYHGARYYAPWLGRWTICDPAGLVDGTNTYNYVHNTPIQKLDLRGTDGENWELMQQRHLREQVRATAVSRGITPTKRGRLQGLGRQWGLKEIDVGHADPFVTTPAGQVSDVFAQPRGENRSLGATSDKAAAAQARANNQFARVEDRDPTVPKGTRFGPQPPGNPRLVGRETRQRSPQSQFRRQGHQQRQPR